MVSTGGPHVNRVECWSANKVGFGKREEGEYRRIEGETTCLLEGEGR